MSTKLQSASLLAAAALFLAAAKPSSAQYTATYYPSPTGLPQTTEDGQFGTNACGTTSSQTSNCQNFYMNDITDFCVWAPANGGEVANFEAEVISYCTKAGRGTRVIPQGTIQGAHFIYTPSYVQVTGTGDFTKIGITANDQGGELDPHGATGVGNPVGGIMFSNGQQMHEWFSFMSATEFCTRACYDGDRATSLCRHTYDVLGCGFNAPGNYDANVFEQCDGNDAMDIMYGYPGLASFAQTDTEYGVAVPSPHPAPASYGCNTTTAAALGGTAANFGAQITTTSSTSPTSTSTSTSSSSSSSSSNSSTSTSSSSSSMTTASTTVVFSTVPAPTITGSGVSQSTTQSSTDSGSSLFTSQTSLTITLGISAFVVFMTVF